MLKVPQELQKIGIYGRLFPLKMLIQIPLLLYSSVKEANENPYLLFESLRDDYEKHKDKTTEGEFWARMLDEYGKGVRKGFDNDDIYELEDEFIVKSSSRDADSIFWVNIEMQEELADDTLLWIEEYTERKELFVCGERTNFSINFVRIK